MNWGLFFRAAFVVTVASLFVGSVAGILLSGPILVRVQPIELDVDVSPARIRATVDKLCGEFTPRNYQHVDNLDRAAAWIAEQFRQVGLDVEIQEYRLRKGLLRGWPGGTYRNVIARRPGSDPAAGSIVIGAHYDAYSDSPGADDNASGVAVLLELARTLSEDRPRRTWLFVAFSTEEPPFFGSDAMGSHVLAEKLRDEGVDVELMIALDLVGYYSDEPGSQHFPFEPLRLIYPGRADFVAVVGDLFSGRSIGRVKRGMTATRALPVESFRASPHWAPIDLSDQWSFRRMGFPAVQVTDTAFMRYPYYHTANDTPEKLDYERMGRLVVALYGVLWEGPPPSRTG